jgi:hypothetical protein
VHSHPRRRAVAWLTTLTLALAWPVTALGHAELVSSEPADGSTVQDPFTGPIVLTFDQALAVGSGAELIFPSGDTHTFEPDATEPTRITIDDFQDSLQIGPYAIHWTSVSDDGDILRGTVSFTVAAATASVTPGPTAEPSGEPSGEPTAEPSTPPGDNVAPSDVGPEVIVAILAGLVIVGLFGWRLLRRGSGVE